MSFESRERSRSLMSVQDAVDRLLQDAVVGTDVPTPKYRGGLALDVYETEGAIIIEAAVAGADPGGIEVLASGNQLTIRGELQPEGEEGREYLLRERGYGRFERSVALPEDARPGETVAEYANGLLTLTVPKAVRSGPQAIAVRVKS
jgi:HSP20 family protein